MREHLRRVEDGEQILITNWGTALAAMIPVSDLKETRMTAVTGIYSYAGGVGKSSTARDLAHALAHLGQRVCLIDADHQADLSVTLGVDVDEEFEDPQESFARTIGPAVLGVGPLPTPYPVFGFHLIPSSITLHELEAGLTREPTSILGLKFAIDQLRASGTYDHILIDTNPTLGVMATLVVLAADYLLIPVTPNAKGLRAASFVRNRVKRGHFMTVNPALQVLPPVITQMPNTALGRKYVERIRQELAPELAVIKHRPSLYPRAMDERVPIGVLEKRGDAREEVFSLAEALLTATTKATPERRAL